MRDRSEIVGGLPRPGKTVKGILATVAVSAIVGAVVVNWAPGGRTGLDLFLKLACVPSKLASQPWGIVTSGLLTSPEGLSHALWTLLGIYFLTPDLEKAWGGPRLIRFVLSAVVLGNLLGLGVNALPLPQAVFHPALMFGPTAAITAIAVAWARENERRQIRFMFFLPMSGKQLLWLTIGMAVLFVLFTQQMSEGVVAPFGGILVGLALTGNPSPARALYLRTKLLFLRRRGATLTAESPLGDGPPRKPPPRAPGSGPALRVVRGGLDDELSKRQPPKDKRYLN